ncbi:MAG: hypothetical protein EOP04_24630 [Proteobacteria bacterium]|nr:MAG: hypothetical protein EOP04_24630 [Pseudomonadota bacterium]
MSLEMALQKVIHEWLSKKNGRSLRGLSRKTGLSYPTIHRMSKADGPFLSGNILKVIQTIYVHPQLVRNFVVEWMPDSLPLADANAKSGKQFVSVSQASPLMVKVWRDICFRSRDEMYLVEKYGDVVLPVIERLCDSKLFSKVDGLVTLASNQQHVNSTEFAREGIKQNADELDLSEAGHYAITSSDGVNSEGAQATFKLLEKFIIDFEATPCFRKPVA